MQIRHEEKHLKYFTYADYCTWDDDQRCELIDGIPYLMAAPSEKHQDILLNLGWKFREHLQGKRCKVIVAPFDVRLNWEKGDHTVVQPDLIVVCDPIKLEDGKSCKGAPDLVIEVLSPSTAGNDMMRKFAKYHEAGVKELWFADPNEQTMLVHKWESGIHAFNLYNNVDKITVGILPELVIDLADIFEDESDSTED